MNRRHGSLVLLLVCSCAGVPGARWSRSAGSAPVEAAAASSDLERPRTAPPMDSTCGAEPTPIGRVDDVRLDEISGVVESRRDPRVLFVHNDSGDFPRFFAINRAGQVLAELMLDNVPLLVDAEDITIGPGPGGADYVYLGDTGNNFASFGVGIPRRKAVLYRMPEPSIPSDARGAKLTLQAFPIVFTFPEGACDVEAFFIDPWSGDLYLIGKRPDGHSQILTASAAQLSAGGGELRRIGELRFGLPPLPGNSMPTSASISRDGRKLLVRTYSEVWLFTRAAGESVLSALERPPRALPAPREKQGEAIGWVDHDQSFVTLSEGTKPVVYCVMPVP